MWHTFKTAYFVLAHSKEVIYRSLRASSAASLRASKSCDWLGVQPIENFQISKKIITKTTQSQNSQISANPAICKHKFN
jgi:hypothetical protein